MGASSCSCPRTPAHQEELAPMGRYGCLEPTTYRVSTPALAPSAAAADNPGIACSPDHAP